MAKVREGEYRLARQRNGFGVFAFVRVRLEDITTYPHAVTVSSDVEGRASEAPAIEVDQDARVIRFPFGPTSS